jgi:predicted nucleotidyltransferase
VLDPALLDRLRRAAASAFRDRHVLAAYAFGSRVFGRPAPDSDLDIGYYLDEPHRGAGLPLGEEMRLAGDLSDAVGLEVDLRNLAEAPLELRGRVLEDGVRIYSGAEPARVALERDLLGRYHDYKAIFQRMHEIRLRSHARRRL